MEEKYTISPERIAARNAAEGDPVLIVRHIPEGGYTD